MTVHSHIVPTHVRPDQMRRDRTDQGDEAIWGFLTPERGWGEGKGKGGMGRISQSLAHYNVDGVIAPTSGRGLKEGGGGNSSAAQTVNQLGEIGETWSIEQQSCWCNLLCILLFWL